MNGPGSIRFGMIAALLAVAGFAAVLPAVNAWWPDATFWAAGGWLALTALGVADGVWLNRQYGSPGSGFMLALVAGILARMVIVGGGAVLAFLSGGNSAWGFLAGVGAGFIPVQVFSMIWFAKMTGTFSGQTQ